MLKNLNESGLSRLEQEFELEMDDLELESENDPEGEFDDTEFEDGDDHEEDTQNEFETSDQEYSDYAERFYELSQMEFESESELDQELEGLLEEVEREYFFGSGFLKNAAKGLVKRGLKFAAGKIPALKALQNITHLSRLNLRNLLKTFGAPLLKQALASTPYGAVAMTALKALGHETGEDSEVDRETWDNYVGVCREAYEQLAQNLNENADSPLEASRLATNAFRTALTNRRQSGRQVRRGSQQSRQSPNRRPGKRQIIYIDRNVEEVIIRRR